MSSSSYSSSSWATSSSQWRNELAENLRSSSNLTQAAQRIRDAPWHRKPSPPPLPPPWLNVPPAPSVNVKSERVKTRGRGSEARRLETRAVKLQVRQEESERNMHICEWASSANTIKKWQSEEEQLRCDEHEALTMSAVTIAVAQQEQHAMFDAACEEQCMQWKRNELVENLQSRLVQARDAGAVELAQYTRELKLVTSEVSDNHFYLSELQSETDASETEAERLAEQYSRHCSDVADLRSELRACDASLAMHV
jgi:hypothetical protein